MCKFNIELANCKLNAFPIEIKARENVAADFFKGFRSFEKITGSFPFGKLIIYGGEREESRGDTQIANILKMKNILDGIS